MNGDCAPVRTRNGWRLNPSSPAITERRRPGDVWAAGPYVPADRSGTGGRVRRCAVMGAIGSGSGPALALRYGAFAALATAVNIATQALSLVLYTDRYDLHMALAAGTLAVLLAKYALDRRWIFRGLPASLCGRSREFALYAPTTCLF